MKVLAIENGQIKQVGSVADTEQPKITIGNGVDLIAVGTGGVFWLPAWDGRIMIIRIFTPDESNRTIEVDILKNGVSIGEDVDLDNDWWGNAGSFNTFEIGDRFSFNVDANTDARKVIIQMDVQKN